MNIGASRLLSVLLAIVLLGACAWIYWPGQTGPALLDDRSSLSPLHNLDDSPETAVDYVFGDRSGALGRPVAMLSFVLEKLYLDQGFDGSKRVNITIHIINGALVMWLVSLLLAHARVTAHRWFAVLFGAAWLFSPLYVSTVLYVVQRMAMLATLFMLAACISYIYWRSAVCKGQRGLVAGLLVVIWIGLALFSKENAVVVVPVIVLLEVLWFEGQDAEGNVQRRLRASSLYLLLGGVAAGSALLFLKYRWLQRGYASRDFDMSERLMSQARAVWDYVGQLLWPEVERMGVFQDDFLISRSLFEPATTVYAVCGWLLVLLCGIALLRIRSGRLFVCAVLIFLAGHGIESTVVPLELYFEHRNYFPGIGVFLAIAVALGSLCKRWPQLASPLLAYAAVYLLLLASQTSSQVQIWSSAPLLRLNHINNHPQSFRANEEMALHLAGVGALDDALHYSLRANEVSLHEREGDRQIRDIALHCIANRPLPKKYLEELGTFDSQRPFAVVSAFHGFISILQDGTCPAFDRTAFADRMAEIFLVEGYPSKASANFYALLAGLENALRRYDNAYAYAERYLILDPGSTQGLLMQLHFATALGKTSEAKMYTAELESKDEKGQLTLGERQTLALYAGSG